MMFVGTGISMLLDLIWLWLDNSHWWIEDPHAYDNKLE